MRHSGPARPLTATAIEPRPIGWRGDTSGIFAGVLPPTEWNAKEHVRWKAKLPGGSNSSPVLFGDRVLVTSEPDRLTCLAADDGHMLWEVTSGFDRVLTPDELATAEEDPDAAKAVRKRIDAIHKQIEELERLAVQGMRHDADLKARMQSLRQTSRSVRAELPPLEKYAVPDKSAGCSTATPLCDGKLVYVLYGTGIAACYDLDGAPQWIKRFEKPDTDGHTASPLLVGDLLIVHFTDMLGLDRRTGEVRWKSEVKSTMGRRSASS